MNRSITSAICWGMVFLSCTTSCLTPSRSDDPIVMYQNQPEDYFKQLSVINEAVRENLDKPIYYYKRAYFFWENEKLNQGIQDIETAINLDSTQANYHYLHAKILTDREEYAEALTALEKAMEGGVNEITLFELAAELYYRQGRSAEAQRYVRMVESYDIPNTEILYWKGRLALDRRDTTIGFPILREVIQNDSSHKESWLALANYYQEVEKPEQSLGLLINAEQFIETDANYYYRIAVNCDSIYGLDSAFVWYEKAAALPRTNFDINKRCVEYLIKYKRYDESVPYYEKALLQKPAYEFGHYQLGFIYEVYQKELEKALSSYEKAYALSGKSLHLTALNRVKRKLEVETYIKENESKE